MSLLDGKYEVLREHHDDSAHTVFEATAPDGTLLRIEWFDLTPEQEPRFERYRRTLKRLKRTGRTAVFDITSRPGARYVAWERPPEAASRGRDAELEALLDAEGFAREDALVLKHQSRCALYGLTFGSGTQAFDVPEPAEAPAEGRAAWWERVPAEARAWGLAGLLLLASFGLAVVGFERRTNDRVASIPDLTGTSVNDAAATLHARGFGVDVSPSSSDAAAGTVLAIEPPPGTSLRPGRVVRLTYALPPGQLPPRDVPRLIGEVFPATVSERLESAGLRLGRVSRIAADVPRDVVIAQSAPQGSELGQGEAVDVLVSDGPRTDATFLPDLIGLDVEDARYLARVAGIPADRVVVDRVPGSAPSGSVVSQSLAPHRAVPRDEAVLRLIVSEGGAAASIADVTPSFVGMTWQDAVAAVGATPVDVTVVAALSLPEGVIDQDPDPGAPPADRIRLTVNAQPIPIPVPDATAVVREREPRSVPFAWSIEPGIPTVTATVHAATLEGETTLVHSERVAGGGTVEGVWITQYPGVVTFRLELNGQPYGPPLRVP